MTHINDYLNKIHLGDCMDVLRQLPDKSVDLVLTDPPYGMGFVSNYRHIKHKAIVNDNNLDWVPDLCPEISRIIKDDGQLYVFCSWHNIDIFKSAIEQFICVKNILIWEKNNTGMGDLNGDYAPQYEMILFCNPSGKKLNNGRDSNILRFARTQNELHPTEKPVDLFAFLINKSTKKNDIILDPFSGSGTTAVACHNLGRQFICVEKDPEYHAASVKRLEQAQKNQFLF